MKEVPAISVVVPAYNVEDYLVSCIDSILKQSLVDIEVIIVNDGSSDATGVFADRIANEDKRVRVVHKLNGGVSSARNLGLNQSRGLYVCFVDSDDLITENALEGMYKMIKESDAEMCSSSLTGFVDETVEFKSLSKYDYRIYSSHQALQLFLYEKQIFNSPCSKLYDRSMIGSVRFDENIAYGEDMLFNYNIIKASNKVIVSDFLPYFYRQRIGSAMNVVFSDKRADSLLVAHKIQLDIKTSGMTEFKDAAINKIFTESVAIAGLVPVGSRRSEMFRKCLVDIKAKRFSVFRNPQTNLKNRIFSVIAIINPMILINILRIRNNIKRSVLS